jgi:hypothetical protein
MLIRLTRFDGNQDFEAVGWDGKDAEEIRADLRAILLRFYDQDDTTLRPNQDFTPEIVTMIDADDVVVARYDILELLAETGLALGGRWPEVE